MIFLPLKVISFLEARRRHLSLFHYGRESAPEKIIFELWQKLFFQVALRQAVDSRRRERGNCALCNFLPLGGLSRPPERKVARRSLRSTDLRYYKISPARELPEQDAEGAMRASVSVSCPTS